MPDMRNPRPAPGAPKVDAWQQDRPQHTRRTPTDPEPVHLGPDLLDHLEQLEEGRRRRDDGTIIARAATHTGWRLVVDRIIGELAATGAEFTAEDVRARAGDPLGSSPNALGAAMHAASRAGTIAAVGYRQATRPEAHARVLRVWQGVGR